ncbi:PAS domain-containing protein [Neobacillus jeddahensis]|uniref:PAS domain-containing protein n=1 Tax=Neobacillus jeddahensis TaxID=1461580 RepID=UPI0015C77422|nr:PAS domain-containing protein [Neobacillus jeddahensis]
MEKRLFNLDQFQTLIVLVNDLGKITFANKAFMERSEYTSEEVIGENVQTFLQDFRPI